MTQADAKGRGRSDLQPEALFGADGSQIKVRSTGLRLHFARVSRKENWMGSAMELSGSAGTYDQHVNGRPTHAGIVVGIGASAGGLEALESLLQNLSPKSGASFVIIQHLSPDFGSVMDQLLSRHTSMPVKPIVDATAIQPDTIYLLPRAKR